MYYILLYAFVTLPQLCHLYDPSLIEELSVIQGDTIFLDYHIPSGIHYPFVSWYVNSALQGNATMVSYGITNTQISYAPDRGERYNIVFEDNILTLEIEDVKLSDGVYEYICGSYYNWNEIYKVYRLSVLQPKCTVVYTNNKVKHQSTLQLKAEYFNVTIHCAISLPTTLRWLAPDASVMSEKYTQANERFIVTLVLNDTHEFTEFKCITATGAFCIVIPLEKPPSATTNPMTSASKIDANVLSSSTIITSLRVLPTSTPGTKRGIFPDHSHHTATAAVPMPDISGMTSSQLRGSSTTYLGITNVFEAIDNADNNNSSSFSLITYIVSGTMGFLIITVGIATACALRKKRARESNTTKAEDSLNDTASNDPGQKRIEQSLATNTNAEGIDGNDGNTMCTPVLPKRGDIESQNAKELDENQSIVAIVIDKSNTMKSSCSFSYQKPVQASSRSTELGSNLSKVTCAEQRLSEYNNEPSNSTITADHDTHLYYIVDKKNAEHRSDFCSATPQVNDEILTGACDEDNALYALPLQKGGGHTLVKSHASKLPSIPLQESIEIATGSLMTDRNTSREDLHEIDEDLYNTIDEVKPLKNENPQVSSTLRSKEDNVDAYMQGEHRSIMIPENKEETLGEPPILPIVDTQADIKKSTVAQDGDVLYAKPLQKGGGHTMVRARAAQLPSIPLQEITQIDTDSLMPERNTSREDQHEIDKDLYNTIDDVKPFKNETPQVTSPLSSKETNELPPIPIQKRGTEINTDSAMPEWKILCDDQHEIDEDLYNTIDDLKPVNNDNPQVIPSKVNKGDAYTPEEQHYDISAHVKEAHADSTSSAHGESLTLTVVNTQADIEKTAVTQDDDDDDVVYAQPLQKGGGHVVFRPVTAASNSPLSSGQTGVKKDGNDDKLH